MERRCPSYEAGYDASDPFGPVLDRRAGRVLRRRCRSEGIERSPYEDATRAPRTVPNKSHFTLNSAEQIRRDLFVHECHRSAPENGDYLMAHEHARPSGSPVWSKTNKMNPIRPLLVTNTQSEDKRLPKVEELFEKVDHDITGVAIAKQPLKSILNNSLPISPPQGILKKPKNRTSLDSKLSIEGRRRQRASSESDNLFYNYNNSSLSGYDVRVPYTASNTSKRSKDNSGSGYSYGTAIASYTTQARKTSPVFRKSPGHMKTQPIPSYPKPPSICKEDCDIKTENATMQILRTTAINDIAAVELEPIAPPRTNSPTVCPAVSPALPVSSVTAAPAVPPPKNQLKPVVRKKLKKKKMKDYSKTSMHEGDDDSRSRSPSPGNALSEMETEPLAMQIEKFVKSEKTHLPYVTAVKPMEAPLVSKSITKVPHKLTNGAIVQPINTMDSKMKKILPKEKPTKDLLITLHTTHPFKNPIFKETLCDLPDSVTNCLRKSLFPRVPPYLKFIGPEDVPTLKIPMGLQRHLKWKLTSITPIVVRRTLTNSGFKLVKSECDTSECPQEETVEWIGIWGKHMKSIMFRAIKDGQKMNHFPGTFQIGRKDRLWRNLQKLVNKFGIKEFGIMPKTYVLPHDMKLLKHDWDKCAAEDERWIIKPPASARGTGIKVVSRWTQIPKKRPVVVQKYVSKPYLINGTKFDMRLYVLVTSIHPLRIYVYNDGLARFASVKYNDEIASLNDRYMHLTNYSINRLSKSYTPNEDFAACEGHKWTLQTLFQYLKTEKGVDTNALWESMKDLVVKTIISGEGSISSLTKANITSRYNCYELFGIDILLDEELKPWLLEVNISPSLHSASPLDIHVKGPMVTSVLNLAQFQVPSKINLEALTKDKPHKLNGLPYDSRLYTVYLSKEERDKHIIYTNMEERDTYLRDILSTLTPDDVRHLIQAEDELTQLGSMERVFPTSKSYKYLTYLTGPRYYNRLFDAWETRYGYNREAGIDLLRNLCDIGYHLEVPPVPLKNDVDAPSPVPSERPSIVSLELVAATSARSVASGPRTCGDFPAASTLPPPIEPRA